MGRRANAGCTHAASLYGHKAWLINLVDKLLNAVTASGGGDLIENFALVITAKIVGNLLGIPRADTPPLRRWSLANPGALEPKLTPEQEALGNRGARESTDYLKTLIASRRTDPGNTEN